MAHKKLSRRTSRRIIYVALTLAVTGALGLILWNSFLQPKQSTDTHTSIKPATEECLREFDKKKPPTKGLADHRDKSECYPDIVPYNSLSQEQKVQYEKNRLVIEEAIKLRDDMKCNFIRGAYYSFYPPNVTKVMLKTEEEARGECVSLVKNKIKSDSRNNRATEVINL